MMTPTTMTSSSGEGPTHWRCLFCNSEQTTKAFDKKPINILFGGDGKSKDNLGAQLSHFFMLRNVLGLPTQFLEELLKEHGSPASWNIQLCRPCSRIFGEAEYLWEKIQGLQKEFEKVALDIKDLLVNSISSEEGEALEMLLDDSDAQKTAATIKEQLKSHKVPVLKTVRATFFLCLHEQSSETEVGRKSWRPSTGKFCADDNQSKTTMKSKLDWHQTGIPFLAMADFEKKMEDFGETITSISKTKATSIVVEPKSNSSKSRNEAKIVLNDDNDENGSNVITTSQSRSEKPSTSPTSFDTCSSSEGPTPQIQRQISHEEMEDLELPAIRIVNPSSLMELEDDDEEDAVPQVMRRIVNDFIDTEVVHGECEDPLGSDYNAVTVDIDGNLFLEAPFDNGTVRNPLFQEIVSDEMVESGGNFQCSKCGAEFVDRSLCQSHILQDHYGERQPFHCQICSAKFQLRHQIIEHIFQSHGQSNSPELNPHSDNPSFIAIAPTPESHTIVGGCPTNRRKQKHQEANPHLDGNIYPKPALSYSCLIAMALKNSKAGSLAVSNIYKFMCDHFPYFKSAPSGWKNSVRHNLSLNSWFQKIGIGKGSFWGFNPAKLQRMNDGVKKNVDKDPVAIKRAMPEPENLKLIEKGELKRDYSGAGASDDDEDESISEPATSINQIQGHGYSTNSFNATKENTTATAVVTPVVTTVSQVQALHRSIDPRSQTHVQRKVTVGHASTGGRTYLILQTLGPQPTPFTNPHLPDPDCEIIATSNW